MAYTLRVYEDGDLITCNIGVPILVERVFLYRTGINATMAMGVKERGQTRVRPLTEEEAEIAINAGLAIRLPKIQRRARS